MSKTPKSSNYIFFGKKPVLVCFLIFYKSWVMGHKAGMVVVAASKMEDPNGKS